MTTPQAADSGTPAAGTPARTTRWLSAGEYSAWRNFLEAGQLIRAQLDAELREQHDLSISEYELLVRLSETDEHTMRMSRLAAETAVSRSRLSHLVARMERRGLVDRVPFTEDGRGITCVLTEAGHKLLVDAAPGHVESVREHFVDRLDRDQIAPLGKAMMDVATRLREVRRIERY